MIPRVLPTAVAVGRIAAHLDAEAMDFYVDLPPDMCDDDVPDLRELHRRLLDLGLDFIAESELATEDLDDGTTRLHLEVR